MNIANLQLLQAYNLSPLFTPSRVLGTQALHAPHQRAPSAEFGWLRLCLLQTTASLPLVSPVFRGTKPHAPPARLIWPSCCFTSCCKFSRFSIQESSFDAKNCHSFLPSLRCSEDFTSTTPR